MLVRCVLVFAVLCSPAMAIDLAIKNARVVVGNGEEIDGATVTVIDGRIESVRRGRGDTCADREIDASGKTVMPGLIDAHVHLFSGLKGRGEQAFRDELREDIPAILKEYLRHGVTTIKSTGDPLSLILELRHSLQQRQLPGPRLLVVGPGFTAPGGHPAVTILKGDPWWRSQHSVEVADPDAAQQEVRRVAKAGVDAIKVIFDGGPFTDGGGAVGKLSPEVMRVIIEEGHAQKLRVTVHTRREKDAIAAIEAIAGGQDRILLVMATGTGKTYTAFQIIWRLWKSGRKKRILFLADRNILVDQTKTNDFKPFGSAMTKVVKRMVDKSYEIYLSLYQAITGTEEDKNIYKQFSPDFFDLIVIDECHRGSAREDSQWREILEYFSTATHIGLTATPKETKYVSNIHYFGDPIYTYSLKEGINDGFLAPYRVIRVHLDLDMAGWRPEAGKRDKYQREIEDRVYNQKDYDKNLVMTQRTELVASRVAEYLAKTDPYAKTIVFCEDIDHADRMRTALMNRSAELVAQNRKYVMRITGDNEEGKAELDNFIDPEQRYPVIATTSRLMSTGVDAKTCKLVVLDRTIGSMIEFKQIIGRGTRIDEDYGKTHFTIMDFRKATEKFADPEFDGPPEKIYEPDEDGDIVPPDDDESPGPDDENEAIEDKPDIDFPTGDTPPKKFVVDDVEFSVAVEQVQHVDKDGKLITESLRDYTRRTIRGQFDELTDFLSRWTQSDRKTAVIEELEEQGIYFDALSEAVGHEFDAFDLVCHVAFDQPPLTRRDRANNVRKRDYFTKYGEQARSVLEALLDKYANQGLRVIEKMEVLRVQPLDEFGTPIEIVGLFGGKQQYLKAIAELEAALYEAAA